LFEQVCNNTAAGWTL